MCVNETMLHIEFCPYSKPNGDLFMPVTRNLVWHRLMKLHFIQHHTFQQCSGTFKLNKCAEYLNLAVNNQPTWIESNSSLLKCAKACKLIQLLLAFSAVSSFPRFLGRDANMVVSYRLVLYWQYCYTWVILQAMLYTIIESIT